MTLVSRPINTELAQGSAGAAARMGHAAAAARLQRDPMNASYSCRIQQHGSRFPESVRLGSAARGMQRFLSRVCYMLTPSVAHIFHFQCTHTPSDRGMFPMHLTTTTGCTGSRLMSERNIRSNVSLSKFWITFCRARDAGNDQYKAAVEASGGDDAAIARILVLPLRSLYGS